MKPSGRPTWTCRPSASNNTSKRRSTTSTASSGTGSSPRRWPRPSSSRRTSTSAPRSISSRPRARSSSSTASWPSSRTGTRTRDILPKAFEGEVLTLVGGEAGLEGKQNFTQPPPRYTEGTLVKELEAKGIGRPSTYAPIISTLQDRVYVVREKGKFIPTELGMFVTDFLVKNFADLMEVKFTAQMEEELDQISEGGRPWLGILREYYDRLDKDLKNGQRGRGASSTPGSPSKRSAPNAASALVIKSGRFGRFKACSGYPGLQVQGEPGQKGDQDPRREMPQCGAPLVHQVGKYGSFIACSDYPKCKYIQKEKKDTGIACPNDCGGTMLQRKTRRGKFFYGCSSFPKCRFATWDEPVARPCPLCGRKFVLKKNLLKGDPTFIVRMRNAAYKEIVPREKLWEKAGETPAGPAKDEKDRLRNSSPT